MSNDVGNCQMTDYFRNDVLMKRPYIQLHWCLAAIQTPIRREIRKKMDVFAIGGLSQNCNVICE